MRTYADQRARELNMTRAQWAVLVRLQRCEGVKQSELAEALDLAPITLARLIDKLSAAGLVERRDDDDGPARQSPLSDREGHARRLKKLGALGEEMMGKALAGLDADQIAELTAGLERIKANLKTELNAGV